MLLLLVLSACNPNDDAPDTQSEPDIQARHNRIERVLVTNRTSRDISVINARNNNVIRTIPMPDNGEPMYVVHVKQAHRVLVGDRANNRIVAFNERTYNVEGFAPTGSGIFHMWASPDGCQLWVVNNIDNSLSVIDPHNLSVLATIPIPADLIALGGTVHDVVISPNSHAAFATVLGVSGPNDFVIKYNTSTFNEVRRVAVGKDPHVMVNHRSNALYAACMITGEVYVLQRGNLSTQAIVPFNGAHGVAMSPNGRFLYLTDFLTGRFGVMYTPTNTILSGTFTTPFPKSHNIAVNRRGNRAYVTHSGPTANQLTVYRTNPRPTLLTTLTLGTNPLSVMYYTLRRY